MDLHVGAGARTAVRMRQRADARRRTLALAGACSIPGVILGTWGVIASGVLRGPDGPAGPAVQADPIVQFTVPSAVVSPEAFARAAAPLPDARSTRVTRSAREAAVPQAAAPAGTRDRATVRVVVPSRSENSGPGGYVEVPAPAAAGTTSRPTSGAPSTDGTSSSPTGSASPSPSGSSGTPTRRGTGSPTRSTSGSTTDSTTGSPSDAPSTAALTTDPSPADASPDPSGSPTD